MVLKMNKYSEDQILKIAKRHNNKKRTYLLVDPLQAKHIPVSPSAASELMNMLGKSVSKKYPKASLVIGFAETATAIASAVAENMGECIYVQTTRENIDSAGKWIYFEELHSHAVEQKLYLERISNAILDSPQIIFIDDEVSTGHTLLNAVDCIRRIYPEIKNKKIIMASIINRVSEENMKKLRENNIECISICKAKERDYENEVSNINTVAPDLLYFDADINSDYTTVRTENKLSDPRMGLKISDYRKSIDLFCGEAMIYINAENAKSILVIGTEECMYPALIFGKKLEDKYNADVYCHATTRSPIGISEQGGYPIRNGYQFRSFYDNFRTTYIYNIKKYDEAVLVTDTKNNISADIAMKALCALLKEYGCKKITMIRG